MGKTCRVSRVGSKVKAEKPCKVNTFALERSTYRPKSGMVFLGTGRGSNGIVFMHADDEPATINLASEVDSSMRPDPRTTRHVATTAQSRPGMKCRLPYRVRLAGTVLVVTVVSNYIIRGELAAGRAGGPCPRPCPRAEHPRETSERTKRKGCLFLFIYHCACRKANLPASDRKGMLRLKYVDTAVGEVASDEYRTG